MHDPALREGGRPAAIFLSGNGPLVKIVRGALVRDLERHSPKSRDGARQVATFIQNVHSFLGYYAFQAPEELPPEHVVIFDEAQRAWDGKQMALKKRGHKSEAALMLEVMGRCPNWSVVIALVGFRREIHQGEAGLQEWGRAISGMSPAWRVVASPMILAGARWISVIKPAMRRYILNKYRVLLTRARRGFVIWVPPGSADDPTRKQERLDATAAFLIECGMREC